MNVALINPNTRHKGSYTVYPFLGILSIAAMLREHGHRVAVFDADVDNLGHADLLDRLSQWRPGFVGITMNSLQVCASFDLARAIKEQQNELMIGVGGPHASALPEWVLETCSDIDVVVCGEGERTALDLVGELERCDGIQDVAGVCYRDRKGSIVRTAERTFLDDLDALPMPAYDLAAPLHRYGGAYPSGAMPTMYLMGSRGCPFGCSFCSNPIWGRRTRFRSPESLLDEIEHLHDAYGVKELFFQDDTFNLRREWFEDICHGLIARGLDRRMILKSPFRADERLVDASLLKLARRAGFWMIFYGIESGNQEILDKIGKGLRLEELERAVRLTREAGIRTYGSFMIGNLGESRETITDTIRFAEKLSLDYWGFAVAIPYPGSSFYRTAKERGILREPELLDFEPGRCYLRHDSLSGAEIVELRECAEATLVGERGSPLPDGYLPVCKETVKVDMLDGSVEMGINDVGHLGTGWYPLEFGAFLFRWGKERAYVYLRKENAQRRLRIISAALTTVPVQCRFSVNGMPGESFTASHASEEHTLELSSTIEEGLLEVVLEAETWRPCDVMASEDTRALGLAVRKIWLE